MSFVRLGVARDPPSMPGQRLALPTAARSPRVREALAHLGACAWWLVRVHVAQIHFHPRCALEPAPEPWLEAFRIRRS
jgi:hypothetical protein